MNRSVPKEQRLMSLHFLIKLKYRNSKRLESKICPITEWLNGRVGMLFVALF